MTLFLRWAVLEKQIFRHERILHREPLPLRSNNRTEARKRKKEGKIKLLLRKLKKKTVLDALYSGITRPLDGKPWI